MICSYCKYTTQDTKTCDFCQADLTTQRPKLNPRLDDSAVNLSQPELIKLHTYDLMRLLRHVRADRSNMYRNMQVVRKTPYSAKIEQYDDVNEYGQSLYREITAQKNVIEQILIDRMGYYPYRIDNKLLAALKSKIERCERNE